MTQVLFKLLTFSLGLYALLPTALARLCHIGVIWQGPRGGRKVAITFDDGPDPVYTPRVLDILKQHGVRGCFFVLGYKAKAHPELITRMIAEGHEVASHGFHHHLPWFLGPRAMFREVRRASQVIQEITGQPPRLYRPPWGLFNLLSLLHSYLFGQRVVLWSFMSWDWGRRCTPESITRQVLSRVRDGSILVFHDSDDTPGAAPGAPEKMLAALPLIIDGLQQRGLSIVPMAELYLPQDNFWKRLGQRMDSLIIRLLGIKELHLEGRPTLFRLRTRRYYGRPITLSDGTLLRAGDPIVELHLNNEMLKEITSTGKSPERIALLTLKEVKRSLPALARWVHSTPQGKNIRAVVGLTILYRGTERLGFTVSDPPATITGLASWYQGWLLSFYHAEGRLRFNRHKKKLSAKIVAMGREELLRRYLQQVPSNDPKKDRQQQEFVCAKENF
ncbi:polysaccharide deacetylase family protein [Desulfofundulus sp.]|uniref:polysaccharide deacetylase family protein n=1 Tax=Desulfofundulus sp. TaxID=2282750 RepID=UPI003C73EDA8